jgi:anaerobic magnesium-protoporphyrin IX monomethyl ester cyclase
MTDVLLVQLPSPAFKNVFREWAGGMGTELRSPRPYPGHDQKYYDIPFSSLLYIAADLRDRRIDFCYHDLQGEERFDADAFFADLAAQKPKVLVSVVNFPSFTSDMELLARTREIVPGIKILLLGATAKWSKAKILASGQADIVMEEAEELLVGANIAALLTAQSEEALQGCSVPGKEAVRIMPVRTPMKDLNFIDFPAYDLLDFSKYVSDHYFGQRARYMTVFTTKGCPYNCNYCPYPFGFGERIIYRAPERVGADIERLVRSYGIEQILFRDQVFTLNKKHARAVCQEIIRRKLPIRWICETRYDLLDEPLLDLMYESGCGEIHFGLESADQTLFASTAKPDGPKSLDLFRETIDLVKRRGINCHVHMIVGMPDENWTTVRNSIRWLREARPHSVQFAYFMPYPGTPIFEELRRSGELGDVGAIDWEALGGFDQPVLPTRHLSVAEVRKACERMGVEWQFTLGDRIKLKAQRMLGRVPA